MITVDLARRGPATRRTRALTQASGVAVAAMLVLAGCQTAGAPGGYIDLYYDNGDPIYSPLKDTLFDADGAPLCNSTVYQKQLESRFRPFSDNGGLMNSFLFEVVNNEQDPDAPRGELNIPSSQTEAQYRDTLRRQLGSLDRMYQLTHPFLFDAENGISSAEDMAAVKEELRAEFPEMVERTAPPTAFLAVGDSWIESSAGRFEVGKIGDVEVFMESIGVSLPYDGLNNDYFSALKDGEQFLMIRERATGVVTLVNENGEADIDEIQQYQQYLLLQKAGQADTASAVVTLQNDGCPQGGGENLARWWIVSIEDVKPVAGVDKDPFATDDEDEDDPFATGDDEVDPSASPSPSP